MCQPCIVVNLHEVFSSKILVFKICIYESPVYMTHIMYTQQVICKKSTKFKTYTKIESALPAIISRWQYYNRIPWNVWFFQTTSAFSIACPVTESSACWTLEKHFFKHAAIWANFFHTTLNGLIGLLCPTMGKTSVEWRLYFTDILRIRLDFWWPIKLYQNLFGNAKNDISATEMRFR